jgi:hypothetical protein
MKELLDKKRKVKQNKQNKQNTIHWKKSLDSFHITHTHKEPTATTTRLNE